VLESIGDGLNMEAAGHKPKTLSVKETRILKKSAKKKHKKRKVKRITTVGKLQAVARKFGRPKHILQP